MALFPHGVLSKDEKIYVMELDEVLLPGQAFTAQLCKFPMDVFWKINEAIVGKHPTQVPKESYKVGDMVYAHFDKMFCRAEVLKADESHCLLDFVDVGAMRSFLIREIFPLDEELCKRFERVAIHVVVKEDMQVYVNAAAVLSSIDKIDIGGVPHYLGQLTEFSEYSENSHVHPIRRYSPPVPTPTESVGSQSAPTSGTANGRTEKTSTATRVPQPKLNDVEKVFVAIDHSDNEYAVQLARFDVLGLEAKLDAFYGEAANRKPATNVECGSYVIAPFETQYCRALVLKIEEGKARVLYIDYGSETEAAVDTLTELGPGPFLDHPWAALTIKTTEKLEEEFVHLKLAFDHDDEFGVPVFNAKKIPAELVGVGDSTPISTSERPNPSLPPLEFNEREQVIYISHLDGAVLAAQLGQYNEDTLLSRNQDLTEIIKKEAPERPERAFVAGDLVAVKEGEYFYRGVVSKVEGAVMRVYQVDFGVLLETDMGSLRALPDAFIHYPQVGIRCELVGTQIPKASEESLVVRNLRKKTHIDYIDYYEFDLASAQNGLAANTESDQRVTEPKKTNSEIGQPEDPNLRPSGPPEKVTERQQFAQKPREATDLNHNSTVSEAPKVQHFESTHSESSVVESSEARPAQTERDIATVRLGDIPSKTEAAPNQVRAESFGPVQVNMRVSEPPVTETGKLEPQLAALSLQNPPAHAKGHESSAESTSYEFASDVKYPVFNSAPERVHVSQRDESSTMAQIRRFGLNHLQAIDDEIKTFLDKHPNIEPTPLSVGDLVIFIRDDYCRRAEIVGQVRDEFRIACIDYGCTFVAPKSQLVRLPKIFEKYDRCAITLDGSFPYKQGQDVDLILTVESGKIRARTTPSVSPPKVANDHTYCESIRSGSISVKSDNAADDEDLKWARDPEDPCADRSFDVAVTAAPRATKVCVVKSSLLALAKNVGKTLGNRAQHLQSVALEKLEMGSAVVAKLMTDPPRYRRAKVVHYNRSTELFKLFLVDSGLMVKVPLSSIFQLPADLSLERTPGYATILRLKADDLAYDAKIVSEVLGGTLRCNLSYSHPDDIVPGELCHEATLYNKSGNVIKQLNMKGVVSTRTDHFLANPVMLPCTAESEYLDATIVAAQKIDPSSFLVTLLLVELRERLDRVAVDSDQLKPLYTKKAGTPALAYLENDPSPWKRARVVGRPLPGKYRLLLVDVGVEINHPVRSTFKCPTNLLHIPEAAVEVSIQSQKQLAPNDLHDKWVVVKTHWNIDYSTKTPTVELYDHDGALLLP